MHALRNITGYPFLNSERILKLNTLNLFSVLATKIRTMYEIERFVRFNVQYTFFLHASHVVNLTRKVRNSQALSCCYKKLRKILSSSIQK